MAEEVSAFTEFMAAVGGLPGLCCVAALVMVAMVLNRTVPRVVNPQEPEEDDDKGGEESG